MSVSLRHWPWATTIVVASALALGTSENASSYCEYSRVAIEEGQVWRLWTSSFVHFSESHLVWNLIVCVALGSWVERRAPRELRAYLAIAPTVVSGVLYAWESYLETYRGLSGVAAGLVVVTVWVLLLDGKTKEAVALAVLLGTKVGIEFVSGEPLLADFGNTGVTPVATAHLVGAATAFVVCCASGLLARRRKRRIQTDVNPFDHGNREGI